MNLTRSEMFSSVDIENQWALRREIFHSWYPAGGSPTTKRPLPLPGFVKTHLINSVCLRVALGRLLEIATPGTPTANASHSASQVGFFVVEYFKTP